MIGKLAFSCLASVALSSASVLAANIAVIDSASATASALAALLEMHSLEAPADKRPTHVQLTTGDVDTFSRIAGRLFDQAFTNVEHLQIAGVAIPVGAPAAAAGE